MINPSDRALLITAATFASLDGTDYITDQHLLDLLDAHFTEQGRPIDRWLIVGLVLAPSTAKRMAFDFAFNPVEHPTTEENES